MNWLNAFKFRLNTLAIVLIPVCIAINWVGHVIANTLKLPLFLDSIGTILGGILAGPWVGAIAGFVTNLISSGTIDPIAAPYSIVSILLGFAAGIAGYLGWQRRPRGWVGLWILCFLVASIASTPLNIALYSGGSGIAFGDAILAALLKAHVPLAIAAYVDEASIDLIDKLVTALVAVLIYQGLPRRYRSLFRLYEPADNSDDLAPSRA